MRSFHLQVCVWVGVCVCVCVCVVVVVVVVVVHIPLLCFFLKKIGYQSITLNSFLKMIMLVYR